VANLSSDKHDPLYTDLGTLRDQLGRLKPAGPDGFEGLIATALADLTGLTFRLAKSGTQFGRDASTPRARFAIAMEAKRYNDSLRLEDIAGKIWIASHEMSSDIDLWVLCATSEMGDGVLAKLEQMLEEKGISLLVLDWTGTPLPRLAVLLAAARFKVSAWCRTHSSAELSHIDETLALVVADAAFAKAVESLKSDTNAAHVGLATLASANKLWCNKVFSDRASAQRTFGQYLTVSDPTRRAVARPAIEANLERALSLCPGEPKCVALLGPEGVGKSWLAANYWVSANDQPIFVIGSAKAADLIDPTRPLETLARLIASQGDGDPLEETNRLVRRLRRWRDRNFSPPSDEPRFLVLLDGLNERSGMSWAESILQLSSEVVRLGGCLLITCRERFWMRDVAPRLGGVVVTTVKVGDYTAEELSQLLLQEGISPSSVPERVRAFIRNPRICSIAMEMLGRLSAEVNDLTVERLLLEYWRQRLEERGDLAAHNVRDFEGLLKSHAKAFRESPGVQFDRDDWRQHSGAAKRNDGRSVENDLSDIEEGAFLQIVEGRDGFYEFKSDTVPFALGLLIASELRDELRDPKNSATEVVDSIVERVQGFDLVAEALSASAGIACFEESYPPAGRSALISAWLELQNVSDSGRESLTAYAAIRPEALLDALETAYEHRVHPGRREWLLDALLERRGHPQVKEEIERRLGQWLGRWCPTPYRFGSHDEEEEVRFLERRAGIAEKLEQLTASEHSFFERTCSQVETPEGMQLDFAAALLMANHPQAVHAEHILAWALAWSITSNHQRADDELCWVIRLNGEDFALLEQNLRNAIARMLGTNSSETGRAAAAIALRVLGTAETVAEANSLSPRELFQGWRRVENYCASDPFDPSSEKPSNLTNAIQQADAIVPEKLWNHMGQTLEDIDLSWITPGLARFEPSIILSLLRAAVQTIETREKLSLRQLSWHLEQNSPLFNEVTLESVRAGYERLLNDPELIVAADRSHVAGSILLSLLPHYPAIEQLNLYLWLPNEVVDWLRFREVFAPLTTDDLEKALISAEAETIRFKRTLFFASAHRVPLTALSRSVIARALVNDNPIIATCASDLAYVAQDNELDEFVISAARQRNSVLDFNRKTFWRDRAVAAAISSLQRHDDADLISPIFVGSTALRLGGSLNEKMFFNLDRTFNRLLTPIQAPEPKMAHLFVEMSENDPETWLRVEDGVDVMREGGKEQIRGNSIETLTSQFDDASSETRREALREEAQLYLEKLEAEQAQEAALSPDFLALKHAVDRDLARAIGWAQRILMEADPSRRSAIRNLALGLAEALAKERPELAAALITHVEDVWSVISIVVGEPQMPLRSRVLFANTDAEAFSMLREKALAGAMTDAELQTLVFAAEATGHADWLDAWTDREASSGNMGRIARALTVEGFRDAPSPSSILLDRDWGDGFLGQAAKGARYAYERNVWAKFWADQVMNTNDPVDFWRFGVLVDGIADIRLFHWFDHEADTSMMRLFGSELFRRLKKASEKRTKKREKTLFSLEKPEDRLSQLLASTEVC